MFRLIMITMFLTSSFVYGEDTEDTLPNPRSIAARRAKAKHDILVNRAKETFKAEIIKTKRKYLIELKGAMSGALKNQMLAEANAIKVVQKAIEKEIKDLLAPPVKEKEENKEEPKSPFGLQSPNYEMKMEGRWLPITKGSLLRTTIAGSGITDIPPFLNGWKYWQTDRDATKIPAKFRTKKAFTAYMIVPAGKPWWKTKVDHLMAKNWTYALRPDGKTPKSLFDFEHPGVKFRLLKKEYPPNAMVTLNGFWLLFVEPLNPK